jgi:nucleoside-diphosphate-sugar epimerase
MTNRLFVFGLGYAAKAIVDALPGWTVEATGAAGTVAFDDHDAVHGALARASHVLSSVPPGDAGDPVLETYGEALDHGWLGYLSSTGVYGDTGGAWVDETAPVGNGRRSARTAADVAWLARGARVLRLPGIYGPGRSPLDRVRTGRAHRVDLPGQVFSRVHVEDIAQAFTQTLEAPPGAYNIADDLPASANTVTEHACRLLGLDPPPLMSLDEAGLSPQARAFYLENRRVANGKAKRVLGWRPRYSSYREGLASLL